MFNIQIFKLLKVEIISACREYDVEAEFVAMQQIFCIYGWCVHIAVP